MISKKLSAAQGFPDFELAKLGGGKVNLAKAESGYDWRLLVVYRGKHCPICTRYLIRLNELLPEFNKLGIDVVAVSADPEERADAHMEEVQPNFPVAFGLNVPQMESLGLYVSEPRSPGETDRPFSEPGLFIINQHLQLQVVDISNAPFARPELESLLMGLAFVRNPDNNYPVRGTYIHQG